MYFRDIETNAAKLAAHIENLKANAAARLKTVAAKRRLKKAAQRSN